MSPTTTRNNPGIVIDCPVCSRVIWAGSVCHHGHVPEPHPDAPVERATKPAPPPKKKPPVIPRYGE